MGFNNDVYFVTSEGWNGYCGGMDSMDAITFLIEFTVDTLYCGGFFISKFLTWIFTMGASFTFSSTEIKIHCSILLVWIHKFDSWTNILDQESLDMISQAKKNSRLPLWNSLQHSVFGSVTISNIWVVHNYEITPTTKCMFVFIVSLHEK